VRSDHARRASVALAIGIACGDADTSGAGADSSSAAASSDAGAVSTSGASSSGAGAESGTTGGPYAPWSEGRPIPPDAPIDGDPASGEWALLHEGYVSCGIPYELFQLAKSQLGAFASGDPLPGREGKNAEVPYNWTVHVAASGAEIVSLNCLECHAGEWNGELMVGLGKADADYTASSSPLGGITVPDLPIPGITELARFVERYNVLGPATVMYTVGTNPADEVAVVLAAHRDRETLAWLDEPQTPIPDLVAPVDTPPWWRTKKKHGLFYNGMARGDHRGTMMFASSLCTDTVEEANSILAYFNNVRAYIDALEAPVYPFAIDEVLAAEGADLFGAYCAGCHGTYGATDADDTYPNLVFPLELVGTDPLVAEFAAVSPLIEWFNGSMYGEVTQLVVDDPLVGYTAPPLDAVWATAPFLHNGSVPTIELVLDSGARPLRWKRIDYDTTNFDEAALGWPWIEVPYAWDDAPADERKHVYDTTKLGHWNVGHDFGDLLAPDERRAVLEYLKTI
jgi:mono/diheme cytochrome c family protein